MSTTLLARFPWYRKRSILQELVEVVCNTHFRLSSLSFLHLALLQDSFYRRFLMLRHSLCCQNFYSCITLHKYFVEQCIERLGYWKFCAIRFHICQHNKALYKFHHYVGIMQGLPLKWGVVTFMRIHLILTSHFVQIISVYSSCTEHII